MTKKRGGGGEGKGEGRGGGRGRGRGRGVRERGEHTGVVVVANSIQSKHVSARLDVLRSKATKIGSTGVH